MPDQSEIEAKGQKVVEMFGACAENPDDESIGRAANQALNELEELLLAGE